MKRLSQTHYFIAAMTPYARMVVSLSDVEHKRTFVTAFFPLLMAKFLACVHVCLPMTH